MKKLAASLLLIILSAFIAEGFIIGRFVGTFAASGGGATVTMVAGTAAPQAPDNAHPAVSRWDPSCLDSTWGTGCNVATQTCTAPTSGTPDQPCQAPLQFVVDPTRTSGNGTTATIAYTSTAAYTFPVGTPLNVAAATTAAWNTQIARITSASVGTGAPCTAGHTCATVSFTPALANAFVTTLPTYIGGIEGNQGNIGGLGWNQCLDIGTPSYSGGNVTMTFQGSQGISTASYVSATGILTLNFTTPPMGPSIGSLANGNSITVFGLGGTGVSPLNATWPVASTANTGTTVNLQATTGLGSLTIITTNSKIGQNNCIFPAGSQIHTAGFNTVPSGAWNLASATVVSSTPNTVTFPAPSATYTSGGSVYDLSFAPQGPNAAPAALAASSTTSISYDLNSPYPNAFGGGFAGVNLNGYNGTATQPWVVTASACNDGGIPSACHVSFANPTACASSCVTAATQIVAAQFDDPIVAWDTGPIAPFAVEGTNTAYYPSHMVTKCVDAQSLSHGATTPTFLPMQYIAFSIDGGTFAKATIPQLDPWGVGQNSLIGDKVNHTQVYCAQFDASATADGEHEIRACAVPVAGPIGCLTSVITGELTSGSSDIHARAHGLSDTYRVGITKSQDPAFQNFNGSLVNASITITGATWHTGGSSPCGTDNCVTYTFSQPTTLPTIPVGSIVNISGMALPSCSITSTNGTGGTDQFHYGSCASGVSFPVGSQITTNGNTSTVITDTSTTCSYTSGTGIASLTIPSATWGTTPLAGIHYTLGAFTGSGAATANGSTILASSSGSGTILNFNVGTGLTLTNCTGSGGGPTVASNNYSINSTCGASCGAVFPAEIGPIVTATDGSTFATTVGMSTGNASGGTIAPNWNGHCVTINTATSGQITCPIPHQVNLTPTTLGSIQLQSNEFSVVGGQGDNPPPFNPTVSQAEVMTGDTFPLVQYLSDTGDYQGQHVGCITLPCGIPATTNSTIWLTRVDAGTYEEINVANQRATAFANNGSMWLYTNFNGSIKETDAYVDTWNPAGVASGCHGTTRAATDWNVNGPTYAGSYCAAITQGLNDLVSFGSTTPTETVGNDGSGCTTFTSASNSGLYVGEPITFNGLDKGAAGDGTNGLFQTFNLYWVAIINDGGANIVALSGTPGGGCIKETAANLSTITFNNDLSFANVYFKCNTSFGCSGNNTTPETANLRVTGAVDTLNAMGGWLNLLVDSGNGTALHSVSWYGGGVDSWNFGTARMHSNIDKSWPNKQVTVTPVVSIPVIPGAPSGRGSLTITSGTLSGTCPGVACTETLAYTINDTAGGGIYQTAVFQTPTASAPGQGIVVQNQTNTGGVGSTDWNCGTTSAPCVVTASTSTSAGGISSGTVSFLNPTADGTWASAGTAPVIPVTLSIELAKGTISGPWNGGQLNCGNSATNQSVSFAALTPVPVMCLGGGVNAPGANGSTHAFSVFYGQTKPMFSNCIATQNSGWTYNGSPTIQTLTPSNGTTNDVITLSEAGTNIPLFSYNLCGTSTWTFQANTIDPGRVNDTWEDSIWNVGPSWAVQGPGELGFNTIGINYSTNAVSQNINYAFDNEGYNWGDESQYSLGSCHNHGGISFHVRCVAAFDVIPPGPPWWGYLDASLPQILHSYATYADFLTGPTAEVTCSGVPCIAGSGLGDGGKTSHFYALSTYGVPRFSTLSFENFLNCGSSSVLGNTINVWQSTNLDGTNPVVELSSAISGTCPDGVSGSSTIGWFPVTHADTNFNLVNQPNGGANTDVPYTGNATFVKDNLISDQDTSGTGNAEGFLTKGPHWFINTAYVWTTSQGNAFGLKAIALQEGTINRLFINFNIYDDNFYAPDLLIRSLGVLQESPMAETWEINDQTIPVGTTTPNNGYPYNLSLDNNHQGILTMWNTLWNITDPGADSNCVANPSGSGNICGGIQTIGVFPSNAIQLNQTNGNVIVPGTPESYSLKSCPWYCTATDTGAGAY